MIQGDDELVCMILVPVKLLPHASPREHDKAQLVANIPGVKKFV